jgi:hypothetical protein
MRHLTPEELVDLAEGVPMASSGQHAADCTACRQQLADLAAIISAATSARMSEAAEPSPLYWDRLSARVREAVAAERAPRGAWFGLPWSRASLPWAGGLLAALVFASVVTMRVGSSREVDGRKLATAQDVEHPSTYAPKHPSRYAAEHASTYAPEHLSTSEASEALADDPTLSLVADLAASMDLDAASAAGLASGPGEADRAVYQLTGDERIELDRLLKEELRTPGA